MRTIWGIALAALLMTGCATLAGKPPAMPARHDLPPGVEIVKLSVYPKAWAGTKATWVDLVLRNSGTEPRQYRAILTLDDEPPFAASSPKPVAPKTEETLTISTSARSLPTRIVVQIQIAD